MKIKNLIISVVIIISSNILVGQNSNYKINQIVSALEVIHVSPVGINDELSNRIHENFIEVLDPYTLIFMQTDIDLFDLYKDSLDNQISAENYPYLEVVSKVYKQRLKQADSISSSILNHNIDFTENSTLRFNSKEEISYAKNHKELAQRWNKWIKYELLQIMYGGYPNLNLTNKDSVKLVYNYGLEKEKVETECWFYGYGLGDEAYIDDMILYDFLDAIALAYDPHSSYFTEDIKESFDGSLSKESKSFGLGFTKEDGIFKISSIDPASSAWKSNEVHIDDIVYKIVYDGDKEINLSCIDEYDLEEELFSSEMDEIVMTLIQKSGEKIEVELIKETLETADNIMTAILLEDEKKIGYLSIPSFYTNWEGTNMIGCANDVAKEILKLKKENIEGLIIDLRFNGGGSLKEAIDLAGIFIDFGALAMLNRSQGKPVLMKDFNKGRVYSGPLVIMINGASASASEVFAGALQSYNRAVVVGSQSYGKSTGQIILPIDTNSWYNPNENDVDFVKVTTSILYNVNKGSHQGNGIVPDVIIPDIWSPYIPKESQEKYFIPNDSLDKKSYYKPYLKLPITLLKQMSDKRVNNNEIFKNIIHSNDSIEVDMVKEHSIPLTIAEYWSYRNVDGINYQNWKELVTNFESKLNVRNLDYNADLEKIDDRFNKRSQRIFKRIRKDIMLNEAYYIMIDLINTINK